jgi:hypothetical protein
LYGWPKSVEITVFSHPTRRMPAAISPRVSAPPPRVVLIRQRSKKTL